MTKEPNEWGKWESWGLDLCDRFNRLPKTRDWMHLEDGELDVIWQELDETLDEILQTRKITEEQKRQIKRADRLISTKEMDMGKRSTSKKPVTKTEKELACERIQQEIAEQAERLAAQAVEAASQGQVVSATIKIRLKPGKEERVEFFVVGGMSTKTYKREEIGVTNQTIMV